MLRCKIIPALLALFFAFPPMNAVAGPADTTDAPVAEEKVALLRMLNARSVATQERAVHRIGTYAHTGRYDEAFFRVLITPLHGLVGGGETEAVRLMAVSALTSIGTPRAMQGLHVQVDHLSPPRVQRVTRAAIAQYKADRVVRQQGERTP